MGKEIEALAQFVATIEWNDVPKDVQRHTKLVVLDTLGVMLAGAGRHQEAIAHLTSAVQSEPSYVEAHLQLAESLRAAGRLESAIGEYDETIRLDPRVAQARFGAAMALAALKRIDQARQRLAEGVKLHPDRPEFLQALAQLK